MSEHTTADGEVFAVPAGYEPDELSARCRSCRALILWTVTPNGRRMPLDPDGTSHFATCPQADRWRKRP